MMSADGERLAQLLPQAEPMVLLSGYEPQTAENAVAAFVEVSPSSPFFDREADGVPACVALEYMAQAMALLVGLTRRRQNLEPRLGFVLGSRKLEIKIPFFKNGSRYRVTAICTYQDESFGSFDCEIRDSDRNLCAVGTLTAFQPDEDITAESLAKFA